MLVVCCPQFKHTDSIHKMICGVSVMTKVSHLSDLVVLCVPLVQTSYSCQDFRQLFPKLVRRHYVSHVANSTHNSQADLNMVKYD